MMLTPTDIRAQVAVAADDRFRVLVVGAGVAGVTAAGLLRRSGLHPVLVERSPESADDGYMLALMPMVDKAVEELGVRDSYLASSVELGRYGLRAHTGETMRVDSLSGLLARFGDYRGISRGELLTVLTADRGSVSYDTTVTRLDESPGAAAVTFATAGEWFDAEFDLVIVADGLHSATRELIMAPGRVDKVDTHWGGWVVWIDADDQEDLGEELWGEDFLIGSYPVKGRIGVFAGAHRQDTEAGPARFTAHVRDRLTTCEGRLARVLDTLERSENPYYWPLVDCRASTWATRRTVLLGDSAAGFLPTAGVGAAMAIESAWVLASTLHDATPDDLPTLLHHYERAQRPRVEAAQNNSRMLAHLMFRRSKAVAVLRDRAMSFVSIDVALGTIKKLLANMPTPRATAHADKEVA